MVYMQSSVLQLQLFAIKKGEYVIPGFNITQFNEPWLIKIVTDDESRKEKEDGIEPPANDYNSNELKDFRRKKQLKN